MDRSHSWLKLESDWHAQRSHIEIAQSENKANQGVTYSLTILE